jgi:hypothetical protein
LGKLNEMLVYRRDFHQERNYQRRSRNPHPPGPVTRYGSVVSSDPGKTR